MKTEILNLTYASSLTDLCEINSSFDSGILRIAYTGDNRNGSSISKDVFESCIKTIYNCPVVCNYDRETDTLGGHDMELVRKDDGSLILVNLSVRRGSDLEAPGGLQKNQKRWNYSSKHGNYRQGW